MISTYLRRKLTEARDIQIKYALTLRNQADLAEGLAKKITEILEEGK